MEKSQTDHSLLLYFVFAFVFSWFFWLIGVLASFELLSLPFPITVLTILGAFGPFAAAFGLIYRTDGWRGVKKHLISGFNFRIKPVWWISLILLPFILSALAVGINSSLSGFQPDQSLLRQPLMILPTFIAMFFIGGSVQEEFGWRGYALPKLLKNWNPAVASLILGSIWAVWHLPLFFNKETGQYFMPFGVFSLMSLSFSVLFTWFYLKTDKNLLTALLFHTTINTSLSVFPPIEKSVGGNQAALTYLMIAYSIATIVILIIDRDLFFQKARVQPVGPTAEG